MLQELPGDSPQRIATHYNVLIRGIGQEFTTHGLDRLGMGHAAKSGT
jgi:hypothetical protein